MENLKIETYGLISNGDYKGWYVFVKDDYQNTGGYLILLIASLDPNETKGYDNGVESKEDLHHYFFKKAREIKCLEKNSPIVFKKNYEF